MAILRLLVFLSACLSCTIFASSTNKTMNISISADSPLILWYKNYIVHAYNSLNYRIAFIQLPPGRGAVEANKGSLDALAIRTSAVEQYFPDFMRVPVLLAHGHLMLYCQLDAPCQKSIIDESKVTIGIVAGVNITQLFMENRRANVYKVANAFKIAEMFLKKRLDYILTIDTDDFGNFVAIPSDNYNAISLLELKAYHYIHKKHAEIVPKLSRALEEAVDVVGPVPQNYLQPLEND